MAATQGILRPFRFGTSGNPVLGSGDELRESRLSQTFGTRRAGNRIMGELQWRHYFGARFETMRLSNLDDTRKALAYVYATEAIQDTLPTEVVDRIAFDDNELGNVDITVFTKPRQTSGKPSTIAPKVQVKRK